MVERWFIRGIESCWWFGDRFEWVVKLGVGRVLVT